MDQKPKTRGSPKKAERPKEKDEKQFERFVETARIIGAEDKTFEKVFDKIAGGARGSEAAPPQKKDR